MGVMPLPHFRTLHILRVPATSLELPSIAELGRLHLTPQDLRQIKKLEKEEIRAMAFNVVKKSSLPVVTIGRMAPTEPRVGIAENGRTVMNSLISKAWKEAKVDRAAILYDADAKKIMFIGIPAGGKIPLKGVAEEDVFAVKIGEKDNQASIATSGFLKEVPKYDYKEAGSQSYAAELNEKTGGYIVTLPATLPAKRPKATRKPSAAPASPSAANGASPAPVNVEPPAQDELVMDVD